MGLVTCHLSLPRRKTIARGSAPIAGRFGLAREIHPLEQKFLSNQYFDSRADEGAFAVSIYWPHTNLLTVDNKNDRRNSVHTS